MTDDRKKDVVLEIGGHYSVSGGAIEMRKSNKEVESVVKSKGPSYQDVCRETGTRRGEHRVFVCKDCGFWGYEGTNFDGGDELKVRWYTGCPKCLLKKRTARRSKP